MIKNPPADAGDMRRGFDPWIEYSCLENPHGPEEPGRLQSMGSQRTGHSP